MEPSWSDDRMAMLNHYRAFTKKGFKQIPPRMVNDGPVLENIVRDNEVDLLKLPVPIHHEDDGGRYIGTACGVVTRDPDTGRINVGTYRVQVKGANICASYISNGKQGRIHRDKYLKAGKACPVVIIVGCDPITYLAAGYTMPDSMSEYEWAGGLMDQPLELIEGEVTKLPFPARSEIVLEGEIVPGETTLEGPFGEWHGYYAGEAQRGAGDPDQAHLSPQRPDPDLRGEPEAAALASVRALLPALGGADGFARRRRHPGREGRLAAPGRRRPHVLRGLGQAALLRPLDPGRAGRLAGRLRTATSAAGSWWSTTTSIPTDIHDVIWAMGTRCDPKTRTTILDHCWSSRLDTMVTDYSRLYNSRIVVDACKPYERIDNFPKVAQTSRELAAEVRAKYPELFR